MTENNVVPITAASRRTARRRPAIPAGTPLAALIDSWKLALRSANKATTTIEMYLRTARRFVAHLEAENAPDDAERVTAEQVRAFLVHEQEVRGLPTAKAAHAYLGVWFNWMIEDGERTTISPVRAKDRPKLPKKAHKYPTLEEATAVLAVCRGGDFASRRDTAIFRIFMDNGVRVSGLCGLRLDDVDLLGKRLRIVLKGGDEHWVPIGDKTVQAIDRYLRVRSRHKNAGSPWLWLGIKTAERFRVDGVQSMVERRGEQAGVQGLHPHRFRGWAAHLLLASGMSPDDVRRVLGWKTATMLWHYTEELGDDRARAAHAQHSPSDRL